MTLPAQDIVERLLRVAGPVRMNNGSFSDIAHEAADTISRLTADNEALREALGRIDNGYGSDHLSKFYKDVARAALGDRP